MDASKSMRIIKENGLIPRRESHLILSSIVKRQDIPMNILKNYDISQSKFEAIKEEYHRRASEIRGRLSDIRPRNLPFYTIIQEKYPDFTWVTKEHRNNVNALGKTNVNAPRIEQIMPTLASLLFEKVSRNAGKENLQKSYSYMQGLPKGFVKSLLDHMSDISTILPKDIDMQSLSALLKRGLNGSTLNVIMPICPDYSYKVSDEEHLYRYTFESIGNSVGVVARHALNIAKEVDDFFSTHDVNVKIHMISGDFEAISETNCSRLGVSKADFIERVNESARKIGKVCNLSNVKSQTFGEHIDLDTDWPKLCKYYKRKLLDTDIDTLSKELNTNIEKLLRSRMPLYSRWYPNKVSRSELLDLLFSQGSEYAAMGHIFKQKFSNAYVLGVDHHVMAPFYRLSCHLPIIYTKRIYR